MKYSPARSPKISHTAWRYEENPTSRLEGSTSQVSGVISFLLGALYFVANALRNASMWIGTAVVLTQQLILPRSTPSVGAHRGLN